MQVHKKKGNKKNYVSVSTLTSENDRSRLISSTIVSMVARSLPGSNTSVSATVVEGSDVGAGVIVVAGVFAMVSGPCLPTQPNAAAITTITRRIYTAFI